MAKRRHDWRAEAQSLAEAVPYARAQRIRRRVRARALRAHTRRRWHGAMMLAFAAGAALVLMVVQWNGSRPTTPVEGEVAAASPGPAAPPSGAAVTPDHAPPPSPSPVDESEAIAIVGSGCPVAADLRDEDGLLLRKGCRIVAPGWTADGEIDSRVRGDAARLLLSAGRIRVDVDPRHERDAPFIVDTPALRIEVVGTRFTVAHEAAAGRLSMHEGRVRVMTAEGAQPVVAPDSLTWRAEGAGWILGVSAPTSAPAPRSTPAKSRRKPQPDARAEQLVREVARLRARGETQEAVRMIERALPSLRRRDREALSFELGQLLERARGTEAACRHWSKHGRQFPRGRYADLVAGERARQGCDSAPPAG